MKNDEEEEKSFWSSFFHLGRNFVLGSVPGTVIHQENLLHPSQRFGSIFSIPASAFCCEEKKMRGAALRDYPFTFFVSFSFAFYMISCSDEDSCLKIA